VRSTLLAAGWWVAKGPATGPKGDTTIAFSPAANTQGLTHSLLDSEWLARWKRSDAQRPLGLGPVHDSCALILNHPQFGGE
jgi:queuine tRNA-ribosyltransferase